MHLILASTSPNRKELFDRLGIAYTALDPDYEEVIDPKQTPVEQVQIFALGKGNSVLEKLPSSMKEVAYLVLGFDSMIEFKGGSLGKAHSQDEAKKMLMSFVGQPQKITTGFALLGNLAGKKIELTDYQETSVKFRSDITETEIDKYLTFGDWQGKCGAYSILGPGIFFLETLDGDFQNIIGVPLRKIGTRLHEVTGKSVMGWLEVK